MRKTGLLMPLMQRSNLDISEPDGLPMILEPKMTGFRKVLEGGLKLIFRAIRVFARFFPVVDVQVDHRFAIEYPLDQRTLAGDFHGIPFPVRFARSDHGFLGVIQGANNMLSTVNAK